MDRKVLAITFLLINLVSLFCFAESQPRVGRDAAAKYFQKRAPSSEGISDYFSSKTNGDHYLALHFGQYTEGKSWEWLGEGKRNDVGDFTAGVTYRMSEWQNSMDWCLRVDFNQYKVGDQRPLKMSLIPLITFPDANSKFPLYFGFGMGPGIFFKQVDQESPLTLDYQLILGARFFNVFENSGFFIESGLKNSLFVTSSGQFNGIFLSMGAIFTF